jgi:hypothetical protein
MRLLGTGISNEDLDSDDVSYYEELINDYNPTASGRITIDNEFTAKLAGRFIQ